MSVSVNASQSALAVLQTLSRTNDAASGTAGVTRTAHANNSVSTVAAPRQRASVSALGAVTDSLNRATSIADVATTAGQSISDLLESLRETVVAAADPSIDSDTRDDLNGDYQSLLSQVSQTVESASFDGANILNGSITGGLKFIANADASSFITLPVQNLSLGGPIISVSASSTIATATAAATVLAELDTSITATNDALADLGVQSTQIASHNSFVGKLSQALSSAAGDAVGTDADSETAKLQALQIQQQLSGQSFSIANQSPQIVLSLFKS